MGGMSTEELGKMIADHMENGFLENIIDMFMHDNSLYQLVGLLIQDERVRVRIGVTAMMEELSSRDKEHVSEAVAGLLHLLEHEEPYVRGDAANLLGIIGDASALPFLEKSASDKNSSVQLLSSEAIAEIRGRVGKRIE